MIVSMVGLLAESKGECSVKKKERYLGLWLADGLGVSLETKQVYQSGF